MLERLLLVLCAAACGGRTDVLSQPSGRGPGPGPGPGAKKTSFSLPNKVGGSLVANRVPTVAVDARGGVHVVYAASYPDPDGHRPAYYAYCASGCESPDRFRGVSIADGLGQAQLALDGAGRPRVLLTVGPGVDNVVDYQFWSC